MGLIQHDVLIVTSWDKEKIKATHEMAIKLFDCLVTEIIEAKINGYFTFFISPDGSKEYWKESDDYDKLRNEFIEFINKFKYEDGSNSVQYVLVSYGELGTEVNKTNVKQI